MVQSVDRPDVGGVPPKMKAICEDVQIALAGLTPHLHVSTDDNIMSSVYIEGSFDPKEEWNNGILMNSRYFKLKIAPMNEKRYYDPSDDKVELSLTVQSRKITSKVRKYTGPTVKVIEKIKMWILTEKNS